MSERTTRRRGRVFGLLLGSLLTMVALAAPQMASANSWATWELNGEEGTPEYAQVDVAPLTFSFGGGVVTGNCKIGSSNMYTGGAFLLNNGSSEAGGYIKSLNLHGCTTEFDGKCEIEFAGVDDLPLHGYSYDSTPMLTIEEVHFLGIWRHCESLGLKDKTFTIWSGEFEGEFNNETACLAVEEASMQSAQLGEVRATGNVCLSSEEGDISLLTP